MGLQILCTVSESPSIAIPLCLKPTQQTEELFCLTICPAHTVEEKPQTPGCRSHMKGTPSLPLQTTWVRILLWHRVERKARSPTRCWQPKKSGESFYSSLWSEENKAAQNRSWTGTNESAYYISSCEDHTAI